MTTTTAEVTNPQTPDMSAEDVQRAVAAMSDEGRSLCEQYVELIRRIGDDAVLAVDRPLRIADLALALEIEKLMEAELEAAALQRTADARKAQLDEACTQAHALVKTSSGMESS